MGKVTKRFQFTATDKERNKFLEDLANASEEEEEATTAAKAANSNGKSSNTNSSNAKPSADKGILDQIEPSLIN